MYWYPDVVRRERIGCGAKSEDLLMRDDLHAPARAHHVRRVSREAAPSGVIGDPREATPEKGRAITDALVNRALTIAKERAWL
jgi:creatinine amidohydrolase